MAKTIFRFSEFCYDIQNFCMFARFIGTRAEYD